MEGNPPQPSFPHVIYSLYCVSPLPIPASAGAGRLAPVEGPGGQPPKDNTKFLLSWMLADGVMLKLGDQMWSFGLNMIVYLIVAAIVGFVAEALGFVGASIAALLGAWLLTKVLVITGIGDITVYGMRLLRVLLGAILLVAVWHLLTYRAWRGRQRSSYSRN